MCSFMKKYDCFTYFNEKDIVSLRFDELADYFDFFIVVEANQTFTGKPKLYHFDNLNLSPSLREKIIRLKVEFPYPEMTAWEREVFQRNEIARVLDYAEPDDLILISDADEIPNTEKLLGLENLDKPIRLDVKQFFWNLNWQVPDHCNQGARPVFAKASSLVKNTPQELRANSNLETISDGGWHFSFFETVETIAQKIESFAHTEYDSEEYKELSLINNRIKNGIDPFDRFPLRYTEIDSTYPKTITNKRK